MSAIILALLYGYTNENKKLRKLLELKDQFPSADLDNFGADDQLFFLCIWPEALLQILGSTIPKNERIKLKGPGSGKVLKALEFLAYCV